MKVNKVEDGGVGSPTHSMKLLNKLITEFSSVFFAVDSRKAMREQLGQLVAILDLMDERDEKYQELSEVRIPKLKEEIKDNDAVLRRNNEDLRMQIQQGLYKEGYPQTGAMYDTFIDKMELDLEETQIRIDSKLEILSATFKFQLDPRWVEIQLEGYKKNIKALKENLEDIQAMVIKVTKDISEQNERIKARRIQIIEILKDLKVDVSEFIGKSPDYIG